MKELQLLCFQQGAGLGGTLTRQGQYHPQLVSTIIQVFFHVSTEPKQLVFKCVQTPLSQQMR